MALENFCKNCGKRIYPNDQFCHSCGCKTAYDDTIEENLLTVPIYDIGFFNLDIDFSPYIKSSRDDFKYEICSCGYLNQKDNEYCYMCGAKRSEGRLSKLLKNKNKPEFSFENILCECGHLNSKDSDFCEMCGKQIAPTDSESDDNYSNFNLEFKNPVFCFCGEENDKSSEFCRNCGLPLINYGVNSGQYFIAS